MIRSILCGSALLLASTLAHSALVTITFDNNTVDGSGTLTYNDTVAIGTPVTLGDVVSFNTRVNHFAGSELIDETHLTSVELFNADDFTTNFRFTAVKGGKSWNFFDTHHVIDNGAAFFTSFSNFSSDRVIVSAPASLALLMTGVVALRIRKTRN